MSIRVGINGFGRIGRLNIHSNFTKHGDDGELEGEGGGLGDLQLASQTRDNNASASMRRCRQACWRPRRMPGGMPRRLPGGKLRRVRVLLGNSVVIG